MGRLVPFARAALAAAFMLGAGLAAAQDLSGEYAMSGRTPDGQGYGGALALKPWGEGREGAVPYAVAWRIDEPGAAAYLGLALQVGNSLGAAYGKPEGPVGIAVYSIREGGRLEGLWAVSGSRKMGREILSGPPGLQGSYAIMEGENTDGSRYGGDVTITRKGKVYLFRWHTGKATGRGVGLRLDDRLFVAYGGKETPGIAVYHPRQPGSEGRTRWRGIWTYGESALLGTEELRR